MGSTMTAIAGYTLGETLYVSRYSRVFRGVWVEGGNLPVIIKLLSREFPDVEEMGRLKREYDLLLKAGSEAVAQAFDMVKHGSSCALVVEDFGGESLNRLDLAGKIRPSELLGIAVHVARALHLLHSKGIVHKDVNPANIVWNRKTNQLRLVDLNIAAELVPGTNAIPNSGALEGTLAYIAPEQTGRINRSVDTRSDLYSLGATLYHLATGETPFQATDAMEMVHAHIALPPRPPVELRPDLPPAVGSIILKLLAKRPEDRYQSALGLQADLHHVLTRLETRRDLSGFVPGRSDVSSVFRIPEDLFGRSQEQNALHGLFDAVARTGVTSVAMVSGGPGTGKSSLVHDLYAPVVARHGHFVSGKFSEADRNVPYASVVTAFSDLVRQLLASSREKLDAWKQRLTEALGETTAVLAEVLPDLELVLGKQPKPLPLPANEAQNRFNYAVIQFVTTAATADHPLVVFLDDLQWADPGSLRLIELVMTEPDVLHFLLVGAYRDGEVGQWHPLTGLLDRIRKNGKSVEHITLGPLDAQAVRQLMDGTFCTSGPESEELARVCLDKTAGNPFFLGQFVRSLYEQSLVWFDSSTSRWRWDTQRITQADITDNVVDLMAARIDRLSAGAQEVLKLAACIGKRFSASTLAHAGGWSPEDTYDLLQEAIAQGLVLHAAAGGSALSGGQDESSQTSGLLRDYRFVHDRILEAARSKVTPEEMSCFHLDIARALMGGMTDSKRYDLFDVVSHFDHGKDLLTEASERIEVAGLNLRAARIARGSLAIGTALDCVRNGLALLPSDSWQDHYDITFELCMLGVECSQLQADEAAMDSYGREVLKHCRSVVERVRVLEQRVQYYEARRLPEKAVDTCVEALRLLGVSLPRHPGLLHILMGFLKANRTLAGLPPSHFATLPVMTDPEASAAMRLIRACGNSAFWTETKLIPLFGFQVALLTLKHGMHSVSPWGLCGLAFVLAGPFKKWAEGVALARECMLLPAKFGIPEALPAASFVYHMFISHWTDPPGPGIEVADAASRQALAVGDVQSASLSRHIKLVLAVWGGVDLRACEDDAAGAVRQHERCRQEWFRNANAAIWKCLCSLTGNDARMDETLSSPFDLAQFEATSIQVADRSALAMLNTQRMAVSVFLGEFEEAERFGMAARPHLEAIYMSPYDPAFVFYDALSTLGAARKRGRLTRTERRRVRRHLATLARYERTRGESVFRNKRLLVEAELERTLGAGATTLSRYAGAIDMARTAGRAHEEALASELAARAMIDLGMPGPAARLLAEARHAYALWGAARKVRQLDLALAEAGRGGSPAVEWTAETVSDTVQGSTSRRTEQLDMLSLLKSSRAISGEIVLDRLIETMMHVVVENAGAQRGLFLLRTSADWQVVAELDVGSPTVERSASLLLSHANRDRLRLPISLAHYVANTGKPVVIGDAVREGEFRGDEYVIGLQPKSILCMATRFRGDIGGIIYLENNDTTHAFTEERVKVLDVLTSQIAVSLENALLFKGKEDLIAAYERFVPREFLAYLGKKSIVDVALGDQVEREMTILFSDIRDFTALSERMGPAENFEFINSYLSRMEPVIRRRHGFIDKYIGDAIMALFATEADEAVAAALEMAEELSRFNVERESRGRPPVRIGIGLNSGRLMLGTVGGRDRMDGTVISDAVNLASRVEGMTKTFGATVLVAENTVKRLKDPGRHPHRPLGTVRVKGKSQPVTVYEFFGSDSKEVIERKIASRDAFADAVRLCAAGDFTRAAAGFEVIVRSNPADLAAAAYFRRCARAVGQVVPLDGDGPDDAGSL
jgi:predicted ATPase/class 3 adenylate cyclase